MHCSVLGSSSGGNCTAIWDHSATVLVDCGFEPQWIERSLRNLDCSIPTVSGLLLTHLHGDHANPASLNHFLGLGVPIILPAPLAKILTRRHVFFRKARERNLIRESSSSGLELGALDIQAFPLCHDSPGGCYGYVVRTRSANRRKSLAIATDLGYPQIGLQEMFLNRDAIIIESNHDTTMLELSARPAWLKRRITDIGHLSNAQCAEFLTAVCERSSHAPHTVVLAHISQECNTNALALECSRAALASKGFHEVRLVPTFPAKRSAIVEV